MKNTRQSGFSLMELVVAMMIIALLATLGVRKFQEYSANARYIKAQDILKTLGEGLDQYFLKHGTYPDLTSYDAMIEPNSPLVKENFIPANMGAAAAKDPWGNPYEGKSSKGTYELKCAGDPGGSEDRKPFSVEPGKMAGGQGAAPAATPEKEPGK